MRAPHFFQQLRLPADRPALWLLESSNRLPLKSLSSFFGGMRLSGALRGRIFLLRWEVVVARSFLCFVVFFLILCWGPGRGFAQDSSMSGMRMPMESQGSMQLPSPHDGSGTAWEPVSVPEHAWMVMRGGWELMAHGVIFTDYNQQGGPRGEGKAESVNVGMLMEQHRLWGGTILLRQMFSAESLTSPHPGFPELFQTGETYHGQPLVDHQHPHNVFSELALYYTQPLAKKLSWEFYGGAVGEPALGPVAYMHRASASDLPLAPLSHHLQDSTHISFGVITTGLVVDQIGQFHAALKIEGSIFNGREPDEKRYTIQFAPLDSWSARVSVAASRYWTAQYSYGRLEHPEALEPGSQLRQTASVEYVRPFTKGSWATSAIWGRVHKVVDNHN